ncbi:MAG: YiiG family protein, partial [Oscillospiraceae bacterium]|nr:YiiG family protein [Oscillospiraceae bacterium]
MKKIRVISILLLAASVLTLGACDSIRAKVEEATSGNAEEAKVEKHNAYIDLYNIIINDIDKVVFDYSDEFGADDAVYIEDGFSGFSMYSNNIISELDAALPYADKEPEEADADAALKALDPVLRVYAQTLTDARIYYDDKNYVDDSFTKAQEYHDIIIGQYEAVWAESMAFLDAVSVMLEGQDEEELAWYLENDQMVRYYCLLTLMTAKEINSYLYGHDITYANILDVDLDEFRPLYDEFAEAYNGYKEITDANPDAGDDEGIFAVPNYTSRLSELKSSLSELIDRLQNGRAFGDES